MLVDASAFARERRGVVPRPRGLIDEKGVHQPGIVQGLNRIVDRGNVLAGQLKRRVSVGVGRLGGKLFNRAQALQ